ncbi:L-threonylcarbamoyladenylate synthase [Yunchengibacter salinarum]|uniref:L-threonylcarbamoyladenylate synthase n=1 Tax=Yunchengibacter salinarum TaxID=3133399 RepID=UPI0035B67545
MSKASTKRSQSRLRSGSDPAAIREAEQVLSRGGLVGLPTETVYGLAADARNPRAVAAIFKAKGRPDHNPLICHVSGRDMATTLAEANDAAEALMGAFWPGPLTLVLPHRADSGLAPAVTAGLPTVAVRQPGHDVAAALISTFGGPLAAPSANPSGRLSPTRAADVLDGLGNKVDLVLDGGPCTGGIESTIVGVDHDRLVLLRPGLVTSGELAAVGHLPVVSRDGDTITAPGQAASHYAPHAPVVLDRESASPPDVLIGFDDVPGLPEGLTLSPTGNLEEAAHSLFATLRQADGLIGEGGRIHVAPIPASGIGLAIRDRLIRAAAPRPTEETDRIGDAGKAGENP